MTADPKNNGTLICGVVSVELVNDGKIAKLRVAADYAGKDTSDPSNRAGYFDVVLYKDENNSNNSFVFKQIQEGKLKKGSQIALVYRLHNARWKADDGSGRQRTELVAEAITYVGSANQSKGEGESSEDSPADEGAQASSGNTANSGSVPQKF